MLPEVGAAVDQQPGGGTFDENRASQSFVVQVGTRTDFASAAYAGNTDRCAGAQKGDAEGWGWRSIAMLHDGRGIIKDLMTVMKRISVGCHTNEASVTVMSVSRPDGFRKARLSPLCLFSRKWCQRLAYPSKKIGVIPR